MASRLVSSLPDVEGTLKKWLSVRLRATRAFHARPVCVSRHPRPTAHATRCTSAGSDYTEWRRTPGGGGCDMDGQRGSRDTRSPPKVAHAKKSRASPEKPGAARPLVALSKGKLPAAEPYTCYCTSTCFCGPFTVPLKNWKALQSRHCTAASCHHRKESTCCERRFVF